MKYKFKMIVKDRTTKQLIEIEKTIDPDDIACYYQNNNECFISTKGGKLYKLNHSFEVIECVGDDYGLYTEE